MKKLLLILLCLPLLFSFCNQENYKDISSSEQDHIDQIIKRLYETGSFQNVTVVAKNSNLVINLKEQPKINKIEFVGNKRFKESEIYSLFDRNFSFKYFNDVPPIPIIISSS